MLLVWSVLCKPKAMVEGDALCHIPQGPLKYRPSDKCLEEGEGPAMTAVGSHAGCRLLGAQTREGVVRRHLLPDFRHTGSGAQSFSKLTARNTCPRDIRPTGHGLEAVRACALLRRPLETRAVFY